MTGQPQVDPRVAEIARIIDDRLNVQLEDYAATAQAVVDHIDERAAAQDDTDRYRVAVIRAALVAAAVGALGLIAGFALALASIWASTLSDELAGTALLCAFAGTVLAAGAVVVAFAVPGDPS